MTLSWASLPSCAGCGGAGSHSWFYIVRPNSALVAAHPTLELSTARWYLVASNYLAHLHSQVRDAPR